MIDISVQELHKYYGSNHVLRGITFEIYNGEKIGLLGKNGSGKTTLFKVIAADEYYESGSISKATGKKVEILAQIPVFAENDTVEDILRSSFSEVMAIHDEIKKIEGDGNPALLNQYGKLMDDFERLGGYELDVKIEKICNGMTISSDMRQTPFSLLSGGEKTRVNLARILLRDGDILLLDEPTNHLDLSSLEWLENFLRQFPGTVVIISHDRVFLDKVITRVIEIDNGKAHFYSGNYSSYADEKQRRYITQAEQYARQQKEIKRIEDRAKWLVEQNRFTTKHHAILSRIDHMDKIEKPTTTTRKLEEEFNSGGYAAKQILSLESVSKAYGANLLLHDISLTVWRDDRIALIGANGCGKSTLLKMIVDEEPCDNGVIKISSNVTIAYLPQIITFEDENATVLETLQYTSGLTEEKVRSILASYRFKSPDVLKKVANLSGGEKSRLKLCLLMQNKVNFLILDEPTNHLDIESREWIEDAVSDFNGTMIFISHDRYFLNKFASRIWSMKDGNITDFHGNFDEYSLACLNTESQSYKSHTNKKKKKQAVKVIEQPAKPVPWESLIHEAESELGIIDDEIESGFPHTDYQKLNRLCQQKQQLEERLEMLYSQWI